MNSRKFYLDMAERVAWTFVQATVAVLIVNQDWSLDVLKIAATAGALAVLKAIGATRIGDSDSAATWPSDGTE